VGIVGDEDAYTFQAQAGDPVTVFVDNGTTGGGRRLSVTVTNPDGSVWGTAADDSLYGGVDVQVGRQPITMTGTFTVIVDGMGDTTGPYTLGYSNLRNDTTPILEGESAAGTVGIVGDEDGYTFQAQAGDPVTVFVDNLTTGGSRRVSVTVTNPDGSVWGTASDTSTWAGGDVQVGRKPITMTGTFLIVVDGVGDTTGAYTSALPTCGTTSPPSRRSGPERHGGDRRR